MRAGVFVVALSAACGDSLTVPGADAPPDDPRGLVSIQLISERETVADQAVFFQNSDSSLVLATRTNGEGRANAFMVPGGAVTVVTTRGNSKLMYTYTGVEPGDQLVLDTRFESTDSVELFLQLPLAPGAVNYRLHSSCAFSPTIDLFVDVMPVEIVLAGCAASANLMVAAFAVDGTASYLYRGDVALPRFGTIPFAGSYRAPEPFDVTVTRAPRSVAQLFITERLAGIALPGTFEIMDLSDGAGRTTFQIPPATGAIMATHLDLGSNLNLGAQRAVVWGQPSDVAAIDLGGGLRPYTVAPRFDRTTGSIRWDEAPDGQLADTVLAALGWFDSATSIDYRWTVVGPRTSEPMIRVPVLPQPDLNPSPLDPPNAFALVNLLSEGGYDRLHPRVLGSWSPGTPWPIEGPAGRVLYQELGSGP